MLVGRLLGYCTNVHAGAAPGEIEASLRRHAARVRDLVAPHARLPIGLWLPAAAARALVEGDRGKHLTDLLRELGLRPFTMNGFPYGDFHQPVVKHLVYRPSWAEEARARYTIDLADLLAELLEEGEEGSISTLPIGWPSDAPDPQACASHLARMVEHLRHLEDRTGRCIHLDLEPEPGCILQRGADLVRWFEEHLLRRGDGEALRRHLRVCHDVCHAAVMFEEQGELLALYRRSGLRVGKVQISSAVRLDMQALAPPQRRAALGELGGFQEDRWLHQTMVRRGAALRFFDDLPAALRAAAAEPAGDEEWRVHFHVPVHLERCGLLSTTRPMISECLELLRQDDVRHFEVETYAWSAVPPALRPQELADGIADELRWVRRRSPRGFFA